MKVIARLLLSLEHLWQNPIEWWGQRHWSIRLAFIVMILPILSGVSGILYQQFMPASSDRQLLEQMYTEVLSLKSQVATLEEQNQKEKLESTKEIASLKSRISSTVLGDQDSNSALAATSKSGLPIFEATSSALTTNAYPVSIVGSGTTVPVYASPTDTTQTGEVLTNQIYFAITQQGTWHQLELGSNTTGWIESKNVTVLPR